MHWIDGCRRRPIAVYVVQRGQRKHGAHNLDEKRLGLAVAALLAGLAKRPFHALRAVHALPMCVFVCAGARFRIQMIDANKRVRRSRPGQNLRQ